MMFDWTLIVTCLAAVVVMVACVVLATHQQYNTGIVGALGLGMMALAGAARVADAIQREGHIYVSPLAVLVWVGAALFLGRTAVRFLWRYYKRKGGPAWKDETICVNKRSWPWTS